MTDTVSQLMRPGVPGRGVRKDPTKKLVVNRKDMNPERFPEAPTEDRRTPFYGGRHLGHAQEEPKLDLYLDPRRRSKAKGKINLKAVAEVLMEQGLDPTVELVKIVKAGTLDPDVQVRVLSSLMEFVHSKKKSVEVTGADGGAIQVEHVSDDVLLKIAMQALPPADVIDV